MRKLLLAATLLSPIAARAAYVPPPASPGTATTVLHGNAAGAPSYGPVNLSTDVTGTLPQSAGGTGIAGSPFGTTSGTFAQGNDTRFVFDGSGNLAFGGTTLGALGYTNGAAGNGQIYNASAIRFLNSSVDIVQPYPRGDGNMADALNLNMQPGNPSDNIAQSCGGFLSGITAADVAACPGGLEPGLIVAQYDAGTDAALGHYSGTFSTTTFTPSSPISASISAMVVAGVRVASNDSSPYQGVVSSVTKNGSSEITQITVSQWCTASACGGTPAGSTLYIAPVSRGWGAVFNAIVGTGAFALPGQTPHAIAAELGPKNNYGSYTPGAYGNITADQPFIVGSWDGVTGTNSISATYAGNSTAQYRLWSSGTIGDADIGTVHASGTLLKNYAGSWVSLSLDVLGNASFGPQGGAGSNTLIWKFFTSGHSTLDSEMAFTGGTGNGDGLMEFLTSGGVLVTPASGSDNLIFYGGAAGSNLVKIVTNGADAEVDLGLSPQAGYVKFSGTTSWAANGSVATALTSVGPTGSHTTVQEWLAIKDASGTVRYIPTF